MLSRAKNAHLSWEEMGIIIPPLHLQDKTPEEIIFLTRYHKLPQSGVCSKHVTIITNYLRARGYIFEEAAFSAHLRLLRAHCAGFDVEEYDYQSATKRPDSQISRVDLLNLAYESRRAFTNHQLQQVQILLQNTLQPTTREIVTSFYGLDMADPTRHSLVEISQNLHLSKYQCRDRKKGALRKLIDSGLIDVLNNRPISIRKLSRSRRQDIPVSQLNLKPRVHVALSRHGIYSAYDLQEASYETLAATPGLCHADLISLMSIK